MPLTTDYGATLYTEKIYPRAHTGKFWGCLTFFILYNRIYACFKMN